jgi:membrane protease YdiL (CAAX protease family)
MDVAYEKTEKSRLPAILALILVMAYPLYGQFVLRFALPRLHIPTGAGFDIVHEAFSWSYALIALLIATLWGSLSLADIGLGRMRWTTPVFGVVAAIATVLLSGGTAQVAYSALHQTPHANQEAAALVHGSVVYALFVALRAGVVEELLYRGIAIEQFAAFIGSRWVAALLAGVLFVAAHALVFDWPQLIPIAMATLVMTLLYMWRHDLWLNMLAHALVDAFGLVMLVRSHG